MPAERPLVKEDFEASRFTCNGGGLIEASVATDGTIDGTGSSANPLSVPDGTICAALPSCSIDQLGDVDTTVTPPDYNAIIVRNTGTSQWESIDMTTPIDCSYFTGV